jgi:dihydroflavonol-4-reductase
MILVTGGTGFIGSYIIRELVSTGHRIRAIKRASSKLPFYIPEDILSQVEWVVADILDLDALDSAMEGVDSIIHSAAVVSFQKRQREEMYKINVDGTANLVNLALDKNIRRFLHISSVAALGRTQNGETVTEKKQWQESETNTHYAISKFKAEMEVWRASAEGLPVVVLNPSTVLGYGDWNTSSCALFKTAYKEFPYYTTGVNGFVYVQDVAEVALRLLNSNIINERFIINGENWSFRQLFNALADGFKKQRPKIHATPFLSSIAWRAEKLKSFFTGSPSLLSRETAKIAQTKTYFDTGKLINFLQDFSFTPLEEAIRMSCQKYLAAQVQAAAR